MSNWERYVQNHDYHRQVYVEFTDWLQKVKESLDRIAEAPSDTTDGIEQQKAELQVLNVFIINFIFPLCLYFSFGYRAHGTYIYMA